MLHNSTDAQDAVLYLGVVGHVMAHVQLQERAR